jgi:dTMP kinase
VFITFEGGEGAGKTTHVGMLVDRLNADGHSVVALREPGGTPLGDYLRDWLKSSESPLTYEAELLLFTAARAELVRTVIKPTLDEGTFVVLDRYVDSTTAYQGYGRRLPMAQIRAANQLATGGLMPDLTILLEGSLKEMMRRADLREDRGDRRFEDEEVSFHRRVRSGFRRLAKREPERWEVVDTSVSAGAAHQQIWDRVQRLSAT